MYFIISGEVEILHTDGETGENRIAQLGEHETFGELGVLRDGPRSAEARALQALYAYTIPKSEFTAISATSSALRKAITDLADSRIQMLALKDTEIHDKEWRQEILSHAAGDAQTVSVEDIVEEKKASGTSNAAMAIWLGILIDGIPESLVIGMLFIRPSGVSIAFIAGVFLANMPEAMSSAVSMKRGGMKSKKIFLMWGSICVMTGLGAFLGATLLPAHPEGAMFYLVLGIEALAAGAMLTMIAETMMPEAYEQGGAIVGFSTLAGFLTTLFVKVL
jgi:zinc transporter ZupT